MKMKTRKNWRANRVKKYNLKRLRQNLEILLRQTVAIPQAKRKRLLVIPWHNRTKLNWMKTMTTRKRLHWRCRTQSISISMGPSLHNNLSKQCQRQEVLTLTKTKILVLSIPRSTTTRLSRTRKSLSSMWDRMERFRESIKTERKRWYSTTESSVSPSQMVTP